MKLECFFQIEKYIFQKKINPKKSIQTETDEVFPVL